MTTFQRRALLAVLLLGFAACFGCNPAMFPMFLQGEAQDDPTLKRLVTEEDKEKKKEIKVAVVVSGRLDARQELHGVNRELSRRVIEQLRKLAKQNEEKLTVVDTAKVEKFLAQHPEWKDQDNKDWVEDMKLDLKVDYVIDIEINSMSLYEQNTHEVFRGRADVSVALLNANDPDDTSDSDKNIRAVYPNEYGGMQLNDNDTTVFDFREKFLTILAKQIAYCFCSHPTINELDGSRDGLSD
jgi:hypothetical protein